MTDMTDMTDITVIDSYDSDCVHGIKFLDQFVEPKKVKMKQMQSL